MVDRVFRRLLALALVLLAAPAAGQFGFGNEVPEVRVSASANAAEVAPGGQLVLAVVLDHGEELHSWPAAADVTLGEDLSFAVLTEIGLSETPAGVSAVGAVQWPEAKPSLVANPSGGPPAKVEAPTYKGRAIAYVPMLIAEDAAAGELTLPVSVRLQACDDTTCYMPQSESVSVTVMVTAAPATAEAGADFAGFDATVFADLSAGLGGASGEPATSGLWGWLPTGLVGLAVGGFLGGLVLNLTPCVLPVIPLKIMSLTSHAGESKGRTVLLGGFMALGVVAFWALLSVPMLVLEGFTDPSRLFGYWWFTAGIGLVIVAMSLGLFGMFELKLPQWVYRVNPKADSPHGSFLFGMMTAVLGLPCFGFVIGGLLPAAASSDASWVVTLFVSLGVGMAAPYFVLSLNPRLVSRVPKAGPASSLVKQVLGLLLLAAGAYFLGSGVLALLRGDEAFLASAPWWSGVVHWWAVGLAIAAAGVWLLWRLAKLTKSGAARGGFGLLALVFVVSGGWLVQNRTAHAYDDFWVPFTDTTFAEAMASGDVVVVDFTAEWCVNCKALEATVLSSREVKAELLSDSVVPLMADLTANSAPGWEKLRSIGQTGIPTLAVFGPGFPDGPWVANAYTPRQVVEAIERARGGEVAAAD